MARRTTWYVICKYRQLPSELPQSDSPNLSLLARPRPKHPTPWPRGDQLKFSRVWKRWNIRQKGSPRGWNKAARRGHRCALDWSGNDRLAPCTTTAGDVSLGVRVYNLRRALMPTPPTLTPHIKHDNVTVVVVYNLTSYSTTTSQNSFPKMADIVRPRCSFINIIWHCSVMDDVQ